MKIVTAENGKKTVKISKIEWQNIGEKQGWMKTAGAVTNALEQFNQQNANPQGSNQQGSEDSANRYALDTIATMNKNLIGAYNQLNNLHTWLNDVESQNTQMPSPQDATGIQTMIDQIIDSLESTKGFVSTLVDSLSNPSKY